MQKNLNIEKIIFKVVLQLLLKNRLTEFMASISEAVRGIGLPPNKLIMFTNRKRVYSAKSPYIHTLVV